MRANLCAWAVLVVLAASPAVGRAETVKEHGFELVLPDGFAASAPAFAATVRSQLTAQVAMLPGASLRVEDAKLWTYERPSGAGQPDRALVMWFPGDAPPVDEPSFRRGLREGFDRAKGVAGVEIEGIVDREVAGNVAAVESRARYPAVGFRMRLLIVPRDGFVLMVQLLRFTVDVDGDDAVWDALVAGLRTTAGAPPHRRGSGPPPFLQLLLGSAIVVVVGVVVVALRSHRRPLPQGESSPEDDDPEFRPRPPPPLPPR